MFSRELKTTIKITKHLNKFLMNEFSNFSGEEIYYKKHREIFTKIDLESNKHITKKLLNRFPNYDIISEEAEKIDNPGTKTWYIDPLDGTTNFTYGSTEFSTCIGLENKGEILLGVVGTPVTKKIYWGERGSGAWCNNKPIKVSKRDNLKDIMVFVCPGHSPAGNKRFKEYLQQQGEAVLGHWRYFGSAGIELVSVASGKADACVLTDIQPWDVVAGVIIVREAGGRVTNFAGDNWKIGDKTLIASNGIIHEEILKLTKDI